MKKRVSALLKSVQNLEDTGRSWPVSLPLLLSTACPFWACPATCKLVKT